jgi:PadR family transcriptional regulator PadR
MEKNKWVASYATQTPSGRERKYYRITPDGREQLAYKEEEWRLFSEKVSAVLGFAGV